MERSGWSVGDLHRHLADTIPAEHYLIDGVSAINKLMFFSPLLLLKTLTEWWFSVECRTSCESRYSVRVTYPRELRYTAWFMVNTKAIPTTT